MPINPDPMSTTDLMVALDNAALAAGYARIMMPDGKQIWVTPDTKQKIYDYANAKEISITQAVKEIIDEQIFPL